MAEQMAEQVAGIRWIRSPGSGFRGGTNLAGDRGGLFIGHDLVGDLAAVNIDFPRKLEGQPDSISLDDGDAHDPKRGRGGSDHDFFAFTSGDDQHRQDLLPEIVPSTRTLRRLDRDARNPIPFVDGSGC